MNTQTTYKMVVTAKNSNITLTAGYKGSIVVPNGYYFPVAEMAGISISAGNKILFYAQTNLIENGIWGVVNIVDGFVNISRPVDYTEGFLINPGEIVLLSEGITLLSRITAIESRLSALEKK